MPFMYDLARAVTTNATPGTETTELWGHTAANQQVLGIYAFYLAARMAAAGGSVVRAKTNTGTTASGGTSQTPKGRNQLNRAADSLWLDSTTAITPGTTLTVRQVIGGAATGGTGGWQALFPQDAIQLMPNSANPIDAEFTSIAGLASVLEDLTVSIGEGL